MAKYQFSDSGSALLLSMEATGPVTRLPSFSLDSISDTILMADMHEGLANAKTEVQDDCSVAVIATLFLRQPQFLWVTDGDPR
jgi:hypothetical protein